jgi:voltage-gated potassium channel
MLEMRDSSPLGRIVAGIILLIVVASVGLTILDSDDAVSGHNRNLFRGLNLAFGTFFALELITRVVLYGSWGRPPAGLRAKLRYLRRPLNLIDLLALAPFVLPLLVPVPLGVLRAFRLLRLARVLRLTRYHRALRRLRLALKQGQEELTVALGLVVLLLLFASTALHIVESEAQPDKFGSIGASMWWAVSALTTVGYGDVTPVTPMGRFLASGIQILGIGVFALPAGMLAARLSESARGRHMKCPHCGKPIVRE